MTMRPFLLVLGAALVLLGLSSMPAVAWVGWADVVIGAIAVVEFVLLGNARPILLRFAAVPLALGLVAVWFLSLALHEVLWPGWWNLAFAVGMFMTGAGGWQTPPSS
jgi:hypothetical protein